MSARPAADVAADVAALNAAVRQTGYTLTDPFAPLSFLAIPVIPTLKLTDKGLFACPLTSRRPNRRFSTLLGR